MKKFMSGGGLYKRKIKYITSLIITVVGLLSLIAGTSYAILKDSVESENEQVIKAGSVELELSEYYESMNKGIEVKEDKDGLLGEPYKFSIKNIGSEVAKYDVKLVNEATENKILDKYIKIGLEVNGEEMGPMNIEEVKKIIDSNIINEKEIINYSLRIWLDKEHEKEIEKIEDGKAIFKIQVEAKQREYEENLDKSGANKPVLSKSMIPVYYDSKKDVWRKADKENKDYEYKWYDYNNKMWANSVTYDHTKVYNESNTEDNKIGTVNGAQYTEEGMTFDGENDYVDVGLANYNFENNITVATRFKTSVSSNDEAKVIISNAEAGGISILLAKDNTICLDTYSQEKKAYVSICSNVKAEKDKWYTVVGTYDESNIKLYVNGELKQTQKLTDAVMLSLMPYVIGATPDADKMLQYFKGTISDTLVMKNALSEDEAKELSSDNNFKDYSSDENTLVYNNLRSYESRENGTEVPMDMISTMQVWIPRYKYKVWNYNEDGTHTSEPQEIQITFEKGNKSTGDITCTDKIQGEDGDGTSETCTLKTTQQKCTDDTCNGKTYTHPGFTFGKDELTGFWVGKFELSSDTVCTPKGEEALGNGCNSDKIRPLIKPNLYSWIGAQISTFETVALAMNDDNNKYGFAKTDDTHIIMAKEWGAIAYLSHSKYGKDGEVDNNAYYNSDITKQYMTGCGPQAKESSAPMTTCNSYETPLGKEASTTGNIYGVYDMAGGSWESAMLNVIGKDGTSKMSGRSTTYNSGYKGLLYDDNKYTEYNDGIAYPDTKYYEQISFGTTYKQTETTKRGKLGEMIRETYNKNDTTDGTISWNDDWGRNAYSVSPWFALGGYSSDTNTLRAGVFATVTIDDDKVSPSSRLIISNIN